MFDEEASQNRTVAKITATIERCIVAGKVEEEMKICCENQAILTLSLDERDGDKKYCMHLLRLEVGLT